MMKTSTTYNITNTMDNITTITYNITSITYDITNITYDIKTLTHNITNITLDSLNRSGPMATTRNLASGNLLETFWGTSGGFCLSLYNTYNMTNITYNMEDIT